MAFVIEPDVLLKRVTTKGEEHVYSGRTIKDYKRRLNSLAKLGWDTRDALKKHAADVISHIKEKYPDDDEKGRKNKRDILYSIFWAMDEKYLTKTNKYHMYLHTIQPLTNLVTKKAWIPLVQYREENS
jgi:hypothetical protein